MNFPPVLTESETIARALAGKSLSRFGDGELKIALGQSAKSQRYDPALRARLLAILKAPPGHCLVCIPEANPRSPKFPLWSKYAARQFVELYAPGQTYGSAFVTRPDSAPWIDTDEYWESVQRLWFGLDVVLVRGSTKSFTAADLECHANSVEEIVAPRQHAWTESDALFKHLRNEQRRVILCLGATATVLAFYLAQEGVHALDLGHVGMFLRREGRFERESFPTAVYNGHRA